MQLTEWRSNVRKILQKLSTGYTLDIFRTTTLVILYRNRLVHTCVDSITNYNLSEIDVGDGS